MAPQQFYRPNRRPSRDDGMYEDESQPLGLPTTPSVELGVSKEKTQGVMDDIDSALAENNEAKKSFSGDELNSGEKTADEGPETLGGAGAAKESALLGDNIIDRLGKGYTGNMASNAVAGIIAGKLGNRRRVLIGSGVGVGITGIIIAGFFALLPLKLIHIVDNLQDTFFASTEEATDRWSEKLFEAYVRKHVLSGLGPGCGSTIDRNCIFNNNIDRGSVAGRLFQGWRDAKLETKLAEKYGIEFSLDRGRNEYFMKVNGQNINITSFKNDPNISLRDIDVGGSNRNDIRRAWKNALQDETRFKRALYRYKVGNLLERKYGVRRCVIACGTRDNFDDWRDNKSKAFKVLLVERVLVPRTDTMGVLIQCIMIGGCESFKDTDRDGNRRDGFQKTVGDNLDRLRAQIGKKAVNEMIDEANKFLDRGITASIVEKTFKLLVKDQGGDAAGKLVGEALPYVGWVDFAAQVSKTLVNGQQNFRRWAYITNASAAVGLYLMYRSHVDEIKSGNVDSEMVGSFVTALSDTGLGDAPAETAPLYSELLGFETSTQTAFSQFFDGTAYAQSVGSTERSEYVCNDKDSTATGQRICPEDSLNSDGFIDSALGIFKSPVLSPFTGILGLWDQEFCLGACASLNGIYDWTGNTLGSLFTKIPGVQIAMSSLTGALAGVFGPFLEWVGGMLVPSPWPDRAEDISGAKVFTETVKGANEAGNYSAHMMLGAKAVSDQEANQIRARVQNENREEFAALPLTDRLFGKNNSYSLVSRVALAMPMNSTTTAQSSVANLVGNPFAKLASSFSSLLSGSKISAATDLPDAFGIKQYAIPFNDPVYSIDPDSLTDSYCKTFNEQWVQDATIDERTGQDVHNRVNPCKLNDATAVGLGALYTDQVLEPEDRPGTTDPITIPSNPATCPTSPVGIEQTTLVQGMRVHTCIADNVDRLLTAARTAGINLGGSGWRDPASQIALRRAHCGTSDYAIYEMPSSQCSPPTARPGNSRHERGVAIDFTYNGAIIGSRSNNGHKWLEMNASKYGLSNLPSEPWHWSTDGS